MKRKIAYITISIFLINIPGCSVLKLSKTQDGAPSGYPDFSDTPNAIPKIEPIAKANQRSYKIFGKRYRPMASSKGYSKKGIASWYGKKFHGNKTANGERYNMYAMTAAHKLLPLPTYVEVKNLENGRNIIVRVNDRGPFHGDRIIDLSYAAASKIGMLKKGTALVRVTAIDPTDLFAKNDRRKGLIFIQLGAFQDIRNAIRLQKEARNFIRKEVSVESDKRENIHRVKIGPIQSHKMKNKIIESLAEIGINNTKIVIE